jgi:hypothetical protein
VYRAFAKLRQCRQVDHAVFIERRGKIGDLARQPVEGSASGVIGFHAALSILGGAPMTGMLSERRILPPISSSISRDSSTMVSG